MYNVIDRHYTWYQFILKHGTNTITQSSGVKLISENTYWLPHLLCASALLRQWIVQYTLKLGDGVKVYWDEIYPTSHSLTTYLLKVTSQVVGYKSTEW